MEESKGTRDKEKKTTLESRGRRGYSQRLPKIGRLRETEKWEYFIGEGYLMEEGYAL